MKLRKSHPPAPCIVGCCMRLTPYYYLASVAGHPPSHVTRPWYPHVANSAANGVFPVTLRAAADPIKVYQFPVTQNSMSRTTRKPAACGKAETTPALFRGRNARVHMCPHGPIAGSDYVQGKAESSIPLCGGRLSYS